jgi:hypothetical protein
MEGRWGGDEGARGGCCSLTFCRETFLSILDLRGEDGSDGEVVVLVCDCACEVNVLGSSGTGGAASEGEVGSLIKDEERRRKLKLLPLERERREKVRVSAAGLRSRDARGGGRG